ncbi:MAG: ATP-binding protein [Rhodospirillales bacterium]
MDNSRKIIEDDNDRAVARVLLIEDDPGDALLVKRGLERAFQGRYEIIHVDTLMAAADYLLSGEKTCDVVLLDLSLPDAQGLQGLRVLSDVTQGDIPIVILSGQDDETLAHTAILRDAQDYLSKHDMTERALDRTLRYSIERHRIQVDLRRSRERFRQFARVASDRFWEMDAGLKFRDAVGTLADDYQPAREDVIGRRRWEISGFAPLPPHTWEEHRADLEQQKPFKDFEMSYTAPSGDVTYWSINGEPIKDEHGRFGGYRGTAADITKQKSAEQDLRKVADELALTSAELAETNAKKDKFFSIIAHDLRSPFAGMLGTAEIFRRGIVGRNPDQLKKQGDMMFAAATRALNLVEDLLEWSRLQLGGVSFQPEHFDIVEMIQETIDLTQDQADQKGVVLVKETPEFQTVNADKRAVSSVIRNLIANAVKFTAQGGQVNVGVRDSGSDVAVSIQDTGVGMDDAKIASLFEISEQKSTTGTAGEKGTGLGMVLCKELVEQNGGGIVVTSRPEQGTIVTFTLPKG